MKAKPAPERPKFWQFFPDVKVIYRTKVNSWHESAVREAIEATGRQKLIVAPNNFGYQRYCF